MANWSVRRGRPNPITDIRNAWEFRYINGELDSVRNTIRSARSGGLTLAIVLAMRALLTAGAVSYLFDHEWGFGKMMVPSGASGASSSKPYPRENQDINKSPSGWRGWGSARHQNNVASAFFGQDKRTKGSLGRSNSPSNWIRERAIA